MISYVVKKKLVSENWDLFINNSQNGTIFHKQKFLKYHKKKFNNQIFIEFTKKNKLIGVISGVKIKEENKYIFQSPFGASFGGIVIGNKIRFKDIFSIVVSFKSFLINNDFSGCELVCTPDHLSNTINNSLEFCLLKNNFKIKNLDISSAIFMEKNYLNDVYQNKKKFLKKQENFKFEIAKDIEKFYPFLTKNLKKKFNVKPTHSKAELNYLRKSFKDNFKVFLCYYKNQLDSAVMVIKTSPNKIILFYIINNYMSKSNSISFLIINIMNYYKNYKVIDFGTSSFLGEVRSSLIHFKEEFGTNLFFRKKIILNIK